MESKATASFWECYDELPAAVQRQALKQYRLWRKDPFHRSLQFKRIGDKWSARISGSYRALGVSGEQIVVWFWIGSHAEYDQLLRARR